MCRALCPLVEVFSIYDYLHFYEIFESLAGYNIIGKHSKRRGTLELLHNRFFLKQYNLHSFYINLTILKDRVGAYINKKILENDEK